MGKARQHAFSIMGHNWQYEPWTANSTVQGFNPFSFDTGVYGGIGPSRHLNILTSAGGAFRVTGDYLYRTQDSLNFAGGLWGIFRIHAAPRPCGAGDLWCPPTQDTDTISVDPQ
jgi:hypothetical protein